MTDYIVLDLETTNKNIGEDAIGDFSAAPWHPENGIVLMGTGSSGNYTTHGWSMDAFSSIYGHLFEGDSPILVGHNIKFDLHYLLRHDAGFYDHIFPKLRIWDTQLAEYLLTAQQSKWASLDYLASKYGGTLKDTRIKDFWDSGIDTEDIPEVLLSEYCISDLKNTELVFLAQLDKAEELGMYNLIRTQMEALLATTEMEYNGMYFNIEKAQEEEAKLDLEVIFLKEQIERELNKNLGIVSANADSKDHLSLYLFGGPLKYINTVPTLDDAGNTVVYKSGTKAGQPKFKKVEEERTVPGIFKPHPGWALKKPGFYSTTEDVLTELLYVAGPYGDFIRRVLKYRKLSKDVGTYYKGYIKLVWPGGFIHGKLNHCQTNTGRLSSSQPNLQNLSGET